MILIAISLSLMIIVGFPSTAATAAALQEDAARVAFPCGAAIGQPLMAEPEVLAGEGEAAMEVEFDQMFIDMNVPHHAAIVSAAASALTRLQHPELRAVAMDIVLDQTGEMDELRDLRELLYGDSLPMPIDEQMLAMMPSMPGMETIDPAGLAFQMDPAAMAEQMCTAEDVDLTFIDMIVAHHEVAVMMAQAALEQAVSEDLRAEAAHSISVQSSQIEELQRIRGELTGDMTPEAGA